MGIVAGFSGSAVAQNRWYCGGQQYVGEGLDAVRGSIEVPPLAIVDTRVRIWIGFDFNSEFWIQAGWTQGHLESPKAYYEYTRENGQRTIQQPADAQSGTYAIERIGDLAFITIYGGYVGSALWSDVDQYSMCDLWAGTELYGAEDRVPGQVGDPVAISGERVRISV